MSFFSWVLAQRWGKFSDYIKPFQIGVLKRTTVSIRTMGALAPGCWGSPPTAILGTPVPCAYLLPDSVSKCGSSWVICAHPLLLGVDRGSLTLSQYLNLFCLLLPILESVKNLFAHPIPLKAAEER